jgi:hypothetical protein
MRIEQVGGKRLHAGRLLRLAREAEDLPALATQEFRRGAADDAACACDQCLVQMPVS